jgi:arylsulfatase A-like enzyme
VLAESWTLRAPRIGVLLLALCHGLGCGFGAEGPPSVVLITVDALRPDHLGCYGYSRDTSPNLDRMAAESLVFDRCFANGSETRFSIPSLFTGFLPHETRAYERIPLPAEVVTLAEMLSAGGFETAAVVGNYVLREDRGFSQGFRLYDDDLEDEEQVRRWPESTAEHTTDRAVALLRDDLPEPFFLWVHYQDPHGPYTPPAPHAERFLDRSLSSLELPAIESSSGRGGIPHYQVLGPSRDFHEYVSRYDGEIHYQDAHFERLLAALKERGLYDDALIVVTSDHGEALGEHGYYFTHGDSLYNEQLRVPLIVRFGDDLVGRRTDLAQHLDLVPTILGRAGIDPGLPLRGRDLLDPGSAETEIVAEMNTPVAPDSPKFSIMKDGWKLIHTPSEERTELFDLGEDPFEERDVAADPRHEELLEALRAALARVLAEDRLGIEAGDSLAEPSEEEMERLKSLGYLD